MRYVLPLIALIALAVACGTDSAEAASWRLAAPPSGNTFEIQVGTGCKGLDHVKVDEFTDRVRVTAYASGNVCSGGDDVSRLYSSIVRLKGPLGDRVLEGCDQGGTVFPALEGTCKDAVY